MNITRQINISCKKKCCWSFGSFFTTF